ncbi:flagellar basal-body rod protein FlgG [Thermocrinis albus DSM 14484]|uniref:Flagellar basal-body rod protein FlgG n=1 Tax=Thermocrinis albus (strain DSM 14484 / JCM 11386 / HI 11/12) TaxID=638303 RepID=D3SLX9_THEAH|nr:flagellar basal-body rod protein FlgG [Thermocrinis albus]ADC89759.1 flagellar basal-body rod protein FlgG [Thermocrinis albus DSM 14484]
MFRALWTSASGMSAQQTNLDVISHNMANVNTVGFKKMRPTFQDLLYQTVRDPGAPTSPTTRAPSGFQIGLGVYISDTYGIFTQGNLFQTGNQLDLAIQGDGFFKVVLPDGTIAYTRNGQFRLDADGRIVNPDGYPLDPEITVPADAISVSIGPDGTVSVLRQGATTVEEIGRIELAKFVNPAGLRRIGNNLFIQTDASGEPIVDNPGNQGLGTLLQGYLESSNVNIVEEMVNLIIAQRAFEFNSKGIMAADDMLGQVANLRK